MGLHNQRQSAELSLLLLERGLQSQAQHFATYFILFKNITNRFAKLCKAPNRAFGASSMFEQSSTTDSLLPQGWASHHGQRRLQFLGH